MNMRTKSEIFFENMKDKKIAFIGVGVSHTDLIKLFLKKGLNVTVCDKKTAEQMKEYEELKAAGAAFSLGESYLDGMAEGKYDVVFRTPGMYYNNETLTQARLHGTAVTSEMEVFFDLCPCPIYAVTGSDGKTTTTTIIAELLKASGRTVWLGGNIGHPLLCDAGRMQPHDYAVLELSSFQLMTMDCSPHIAIVTNLAPNHLDMHKDMAEYVSAKENIFRHQTGGDIAVFNQDNDITRQQAGRAVGTVRLFSRRSEPSDGVFLRGEDIVCRSPAGERVIMKTSDIRIPGVHNVENYMAAIAAVDGLVPDGIIRDFARSFGGVEHRIEFVRELDGVKWYNDSIATSPTRVLAGLRSFQQKLIVIMGGYDKKIPFEPMADTVCKQVKLVLLMGVTADKIEAAIRGSQFYQEGAPELVHVGSMEEAVQEARKRAKTGDIVTLSPACASFDLYPNFEARGIHYKNLVKELH